MSQTPYDTAAPQPPGPPPPPSGPPPHDGWNTDHLKDYRQLRRSAVDRKVAGVAGGLGRHLDVDPLIIRVLFVVLVFFGGSGLLVYGVLWPLAVAALVVFAVLLTRDSRRQPAPPAPPGVSPQYTAYYPPATTAAPGAPAGA